MVVVLEMYWLTKRAGKKVDLTAIIWYLNMEQDSQNLLRYETDKLTAINQQLNMLIG